VRPARATKTVGPFPDFQSGLGLIGRQRGPDTSIPNRKHPQRCLDAAEGVLAEIAQTADHVVIVSSGQLRFAGPLREVGETTDALESAFLKLTVTPG